MMLATPKPRRPLLMLKPRLKTLDPYASIKHVTRTLKDKQESNGRTLALNGVAWRKLRAYVLRGEPLCRHCTARGLTMAATEVDHRDDDPSNNELVNLMPLCKPCHSRKTMRDMGYSVREASMGCDANGIPLDPCHAWNKAIAADLARSEKSPETEKSRTACLL